MKYYLFSILLSVLSVSVMSQSQNSARSKSIVKDKVIPYQFGTGVTENGVFVLNFDYPMSMEYTVMITPYDSSGGLFIHEKTENRLIIKTSTKNDVQFDFIIFIRKNSSELKE